MDVAKFFLFNFVVHALTVVNAPGAKTLRSVNASLTAILLPFSGAYRAFQAMAFYRWEKEDDLHIALRAQALCTPIPSGCHPTGDVLFPALNVIDVHGQHSVPPHSFLEWTGIKTPTLRPSYQLSRVPWWFAITPLKRPSGAPRSNPAASGSGPQTTLVEHNPMSETKISCDYNIMKIFAAILQILSGVFQIFQARGLQLDTYGYSAYSLTVIPYVLMSLVNLLACVCIPQYPLMYIVHYGGKKRPVPNDPADTQENNGVSSLTTPRTLEGGSILTQGDGQESDPVSPIERPTDEQDPLLADNNLPTVNNPHQSTSSLSAGTAGRQENIGEEEDGEHFGWEPEVKEMVSGVVGVAYGEWDFDKRDKTLPQSETSVRNKLPILLEANSHISTDSYPFIHISRRSCRLSCTVLNHVGVDGL